MSVTAVVVNYNAGEWLSKCVQSALDNQVSRIIVADNASTDTSFQQLQGRYGHHAGMQLLANPSNLGFGRAVNAVLPLIKTPYILIVNPDCRLQPGAVVRLVHAMDEDPGAALAAPRVMDSKGRLEPAAVRHYPSPARAFFSATGLAKLASWFPSLEGVPVHNAKLLRSTQPAEAVSGSCMLIRQSVMQRLGGFDEKYQLHCEDLDLMARIQSLGHEVLYVPEAEAVHAQGVSSASRALWVHQQKHRGLRRFFDQHLADNCGWFSRLMMRFGIRLHYVALWPWVWLKR